MKTLAVKFVKLIIGLTIMGFGMAMAVQANLGLSPWDVLNDGVAGIMGVQIGTASILFGLVILAIDLLFREKVGFGTFINILMIGGMCNVALSLDIIPSYALSEGLEHLAPRLALCVGSMFLMSFGMYLYMSVGLGAGPRDTLMVTLTKRLPLSVGGVRVIVEGLAFLIGWLLGGKVGLGSIVLVLLGGPIMELIFRAFKFNVKQLENQTIAQTIRDFRKALSRAQ